MSLKNPTFYRGLIRSDPFKWQLLKVFSHYSENGTQLSPGELELQADQYASCRQILDVNCCTRMRATCRCPDGTRNIPSLARRHRLLFPDRPHYPSSIDLKLEDYYIEYLHSFECDLLHNVSSSVQTLRVMSQKVY